MVMKLKESENNLQSFLNDKRPENIEVLTEETNGSVVNTQASNTAHENINQNSIESFTSDKTSNVKSTADNSVINNNLKKVTNIENEQLNKSMHSVKIEEVQEIKANDSAATENDHKPFTDTIEIIELDNETNIPEVSKSDASEIKNDEETDLLQKNIISCVQKVAIIEEMKHKNKDSKPDEQVSVYL